MHWSNLSESIEFLGLDLTLSNVKTSYALKLHWIPRHFVPQPLAQKRKTGERFHHQIRHNAGVLKAER